MIFRNLRGNADDEQGWTWRWRVIGGVAAGVIILLGGLGWLWFQQTPEIEAAETTKAAPADIMFPEPDRNYQRTPPVEQAAIPATARQETRQQTAATPPSEGENPIVKAQAEEIGEWTPDADSSAQAYAPSMAVSYYDPAACTISSGSAIKAELISAAISSNESVVKAIVTTDVLCTNGERGIIAGAILVGQAQQGADFGVERMDIAFNTLQQGDAEIDLEGAAGGDAMGRGGVVGDVDRHAGQTALRVAVATAVDVAIAAVGGSVWAPLVGTPTREVNAWARQALDRDPVISIDGSANRIPITIITRKSIAL